MPLFQSASKKAVGKNIKAEMEAGKPQKQSIAIALSVQRKNKRKKMAQGGKVEETAAGEKRADADNAEDAEDMNMAKNPIGKNKESDEDFASERRANADNAEDKEEMDMDSEAHAKNPKSDEDFASERRSSIDDQDEDESLDMNAHAHERNMDSDENAKSEGHASADNAADDEDLQMLAMGGSIAQRILAKRKMMAEGGMVDLEANSEEQPNNEDQMSFNAVKKEAYDLDQLSPQPEDSNEKSDDIDADSHDMVGKILQKIRSKNR